MSIDVREMEYEKSKLLDTQEWIGNEILFSRSKHEEVVEKVAELKKKSRGTYSEELQVALKMHEITEKKLSRFEESEKQPYFARVDFKESIHEKETFYIGKFGLSDRNTEEEKIIDWRCPLADIYYSGTQGKVTYDSPIGPIEGELFLKRKFLIKEGYLKDAFDEGINELIIKSGINDVEENALVDEFLKINLEESISGKLKDVVATIQKEQNHIVRAEINKPMIVQGSAGSGKTTIALHRLAYLLYRHSKHILGDDILVVAPNKLFLDYISEILPNLGVNKVKQNTFEEICSGILKIKQKLYTKDVKLADILEGEDFNKQKLITTASKLKGGLLYKLLMDRYIRYLEIKDSSIEDIKLDGYVLFDAKEIKRLFIKDLRHIPINKRKEEIKRYFKAKLKNKLPSIMEYIDYEYSKIIGSIKQQMSDGQERRKRITTLYDERDEKKELINKNAKKCIDEYFKKWIVKDVKEIYYNLFTNEDAFNEVTSNKIPNALAEYIKDVIKVDMHNKVIDSDDLNAMLYLHLRMNGIDEKLKYKHIVIDEAQDYSLFQLIVLKYFASNSSFTIVGDIGQGIYSYKGINRWENVIGEVFNGEVEYISLTQSYRSTVEIIDFANKVLEKQNNDFKPAKPVLRHGKEPEVFELKDDSEFVLMLETILEEVELMGKNSIAIIGRTFRECELIHKLLKKNSKIKWELIKDTDKTIKLDKIIIPSYMTKGLEFDCSIIYNCNDENYDDIDLNKKLLYVALTRALHLQYVFYRGNRSPLI